MAVPEDGFGESLRRKREAAGLTQAEAAALLDPPVNRDTWSRWERGEAKPRPRRLRQIPEVLGLRVAPTEVLMQVMEGGVEYTSGVRAEVPLYAMGRVGPRHGGEMAPRIDDIEVTRREAATADAAFQLHDSAMAPRFLPGDIVGIRFQQTAEPGQLVVARCGEEVVFRRYEGVRNGTTVLTPLNTTDHQPIVSREVEMIGVLSWWRGVSLSGKA